MKLHTLYPAALGLLLAATSMTCSAAPPRQEKSYCTLKTLKGSYTYSIQGYRSGEAYASSGMFTFNGAGEIGVLYTSSIERTQLYVTGTYTVNGDCSGTMLLADKTVVNNFYLSPNGDHFNFVRVSSNDVIGTEARRVSMELLVTPPR